MKLLFNPGTTDFWSDPKMSGPYLMWLRQIAKQTAQAKVCMNVVGHTSRTGGDAYSDKLSASRSAFIRTKLGGEAGGGGVAGADEDERSRVAGEHHRDRDG